MRVDGRIVRDPALAVVPERTRVAIDDVPRVRAAWRTLLFHKPRGVVTTRSDPDGRPTVYDAIGPEARDLVTVGRLDLATTGLLVLTSDTRLADWLTDPANAVPRIYAVTVRGRIEEADRRTLTEGVDVDGERLIAAAVSLRKASARESHLLLELREGRNREVRRLLEAVGHEVTRLKRVSFGPLELGSLQPGEWRVLTKADIRSAFARAPISRA